MTELLRSVTEYLSIHSVIDLIDILAVSLIVFAFLRFIKGTRAIYMLIGLSLALLVFWLSSVFNLQTLNWILSHLLSSLVFILIILFQAEIRRMLTRVGRAPVFSFLDTANESRVIEELVKACTSLANRKIGALIVVQKEADVMEYIDVGVKLEALVSKELISSIFLPSSPIHDGAIVIKQDQILAAGCFLPLLMSSKINKNLGTRHRAAVGITEETDALVIVVSEEKGWISIAKDGQLLSGIEATKLKELLAQNILSRTKS
ncbi:MAG TPA: diadenylate cyclase CdaA [Oligoflexia bacterium]|nr:diadenylate cyclase CdaA [Oligoflexia bacterium]HMR24171.1 diadenylate cyclase CdaA [Oligoflexia bacterium]